MRNIQRVNEMKWNGRKEFHSIDHPTSIKWFYHSTRLWVVYCYFWNPKMQNPFISVLYAASGNYLKCWSIPTPSINPRALHTNSTWIWAQLCYVWMLQLAVESFVFMWFLLFYHCIFGALYALKLSYILMLRLANKFASIKTLPWSSLNCFGILIIFFFGKICQWKFPNWWQILIAINLSNSTKIE